MRYLFVAALFTLTNSINPDDYPEYNSVPPINKAWSDTYLKGVVIPNIPIRTEANNETDIGDDVQTCPGLKDWGITYDDGPSPYTPIIQKTLLELNANATFFVIGSNVLKNPDHLIAAYKAGHQIAIHTWSHPALTTLTNDQIIAETVYTAMAIKDVIGVVPKYFRSPMGDMDPRVRAVLKAMNLTIVRWNRDTFDWKLGAPASGKLPSDIPNDFKSWVAETNVTKKDGYISLEHDIYEIPANQAPLALKIVNDAKFKIRTVAACLNDSTGGYDGAWLDIGLNAVGGRNFTKVLKKLNANAVPTAIKIAPVSQLPGAVETTDSQSHLMSGSMANTLSFLYLSFVALLSL